MWRWDQQEPFGNNPSDENPSGLGAFDFPLRFPGQYSDKETNVAYNLNRDAYDAGLGRYTQPEPIGLAGDINLYRYARNNPLTFFDLDGMQAIPFPGGAGSGMGLGGFGRPIPLFSKPKRSEDPFSDAPASGRSRAGSSSNSCPPDDDDECWKKYQYELDLCTAIAGPAYGYRGLKACRTAAITRYGECKRFGIGGVTTPLHGVDTPL